MEIEFNTRKKLQAFLSQISQLLLSDFPHSSSETALGLIKVFFEKQLDRLERASKSTDRKLMIQTCITINERIHQHLPILGFLLRSTNLRNNFEAYFSFLELARALIGPTAQVIISSEWNFSPLTYPMTVSVSGIRVDRDALVGVRKPTHPAIGGTRIGTFHLAERQA
jgi:hypothetical protein